MRLITPAVAWQLAARVVAAYDGPMDADRLGAAHRHRGGAGAGRRAGRAPARPGRRPRGRRVAARAGTPSCPAGPSQAQRKPLATQADPGAAAAAGRGVRSGQARPGGHRLRRPDGAGRPDRGHATPRSARSSGPATRSCCSTSTRTPATPSWCCCASLFGGGHPVTAVGDPCQSIYGWRGATAGNLRRFPPDFPDRAPASPAPVRQLSRQLPQRRRGCSTSPPGCRCPLRMEASEVPRAGARRQPGRAGAGSTAPSSRPPRTRPSGSPTGIAGLLGQPRSPPTACPGARTSASKTLGHASRQDVAVLARKRSQFPALRQALEARGIPVEVVGLGGLLDRARGRRTSSPRCGCCTTRRRGDALARLLTGPRWRIGPADLRGAGRARPAS